VEITPIGIQNIGWRFWIVWTVTNFLFLPIIYFLYPETGLSTYPLIYLLEYDTDILQPIGVLKTLMLIIGQNRLSLWLGIVRQFAEVGHRDTLIMKRLKSSELLQLRTLINRCLPTMWNGALELAGTARNLSRRVQVSV
jgi:hypothetical protein